MRLSAAAALLLLCLPAAAQEAGPQPAPFPPPLPAPRDIPYPGTIQLSVDATDTARGVIRVHEVIPVSGGPLTLLYPEWLPGDHSPSGLLRDFAGLTASAGGKPVAWTRDPVDVWAFHLDLPQGATALTVDFQFVSPTDPSQGRVVVTDTMLNLEWNAVALYPAGYFTRGIMVAPSLKYPAGWTMATALEPAAQSDGSVTYKPVDFGDLVDSPVLGGLYTRRIDLDAPGSAKVYLDVVADNGAALAATPPEIAAHKALVAEAYKLFGSHHYDHYDFLLGLSRRMSGEGLEHHQSSEDVTTLRYFMHWDDTAAGRDLLAHEYTHSWNGKFRRPADLWVPNFNTPMRDSLLWVYEGQTQFWGFVLAARSGLWTRQQGLDAIASVAAAYSLEPGRKWRPLQDTTNDPIAAQRRPIPWRSYQRSEDYYEEGLLIWLDADQLIRERTGGRKSLDDFARAFFGMDDGSHATRTYTFDDVVAALNAVMPYDWAGFLHARLDAPDAPPLDGLRRGGYRLVFTATQSPMDHSDDVMREQLDLMYSLGLVVGTDGRVHQVMWDGPAFRAGVTVGDIIIATNDQQFDAGELSDAVKAAATDKAPIRLLLKRGRRYHEAAIDYHGGLRYPHLERIPGTSARLDDLLAAK